MLIVKNTQKMYFKIMKYIKYEKHIDKLCLHCNNVITLIKQFIKPNKTI